MVLDANFDTETLQPSKHNNEHAYPTLRKEKQSTQECLVRGYVTLPKTNIARQKESNLPTTKFQDELLVSGRVFLFFLQYLNLMFNGLDFLKTTLALKNNSGTNNQKTTCFAKLSIFTAC